MRNSRWRPGASTTRSSQRFDRTATMSRIFCPLLLMLFTFDFPRDRLAGAEPLRASAELVARDDRQNNQETRAGSKNDLLRRAVQTNGDASEFVGKWRNNGEALEPKWRDGDTVPLLPFSQFSRYSDKIDSVEDDYGDRETSPRRNSGRENAVRSRKNDRTSYQGYEDYEAIDGRREYRVQEELPRRRSNLPRNTASPKRTNASDKAEDKEAKYREAFQVRPNDYEYEQNDEEYLKPRPRKRRPPQNYEFALAENETLNENHSRPWTRANVQETPEFGAKNTPLSQNALELKSLLKMQQEEGLSLSEILQRRNLTLDDLLKGKADVIKALKSKDVDDTEETSKKVSNRPRWTAATVPEKLNDPPRANVTSVARAPPMITTSMPLLIAGSPVELLRSDGVVKSNDETKPESLDEDEIMEFSDFTDYKKGRNGMSSVWLMVKDGESKPVESSKGDYEDKGSTLSIEQLLSPTERSRIENASNVSQNGEQPVPKADTKLINTDEHSGDYNTFAEQEYQDDTPFAYAKTSPDEKDESRTPETESTLDPVSSTANSTAEDHQTFPKNMPEGMDPSPKNHQDLNATEGKSYDDVISEVEPEARSEIFELFASGSAGKRLERLLKSRNMSLEELIALRQRGSSKVHLAEVSRLRAQKPGNSLENKGNSASLPAKGSRYEFRQRTVADEEPAVLNDTRNYEKSNVNNYLPESFENVASNESEVGTTEGSFSNLNSTDSDLDTDSNEREDIKDRTVQIVDLLTTFGSLPFAREIQRDFANEYDDVDRRKLTVQSSNAAVVFVNTKDDAESKRANETSNVVEHGYGKETIKQEPNSVDIRTVYSETSSVVDENEDGRRRTPSKVKPTIITSGAILGVTVIIFVAIFIVCRIRQKQKYRYRNSFSRAVFQGPVMAARKLSNSSSLSTVMVNVVATSTAKRPEKNETQEPIHTDSKCDIDNDSLDANDSWETIPDYMK